MFLQPERPTDRHRCGSSRWCRVRPRARECYEPVVQAIELPITVRVVEHPAYASGRWSRPGSRTRTGFVKPGCSEHLGVAISVQVAHGQQVDAPAGGQQLFRSILSLGMVFSYQASSSPPSRATSRSNPPSLPRSVASSRYAGNTGRWMGSAGPKFPWSALRQKRPPTAGPPGPDRWRRHRSGPP